MRYKRLSHLVNETNPLIERLKTSSYFNRTRANHVPIFLRFNGESKIYKFLVQRDLPLRVLLYNLRSRLKLKSYDAIVCMAESTDENGTAKILNGSNTIDDLPENYKHSDGFVYLDIAQESVFG